MTNQLRILILAKTEDELPEAPHKLFQCIPDFPEGLIGQALYIELARGFFHDGYHFTCMTTSHELIQSEKVWAVHPFVNPTADDVDQFSKDVLDGKIIGNVTDEMIGPHLLSSPLGFCFEFKIALEEFDHLMLIANHSGPAN